LVLTAKPPATASTTIAPRGRSVSVQQIPDSTGAKAALRRLRAAPSLTPVYDSITGNSTGS
jgi:hypothetical protein